MEVQLRLLDADDGHRERVGSSWSSLDEDARREVSERVAELIVAVVRETAREEHSNEHEQDQRDASGA
jgi:predicted Fe-S protein YdhL (DUF1289 family)